MGALFHMCSDSVDHESCSRSFAGNAFDGDGMTARVVSDGLAVLANVTHSSHLRRPLPTLGNPCQL